MLLAEAQSTKDCRNKQFSVAVFTYKELFWFLQVTSAAHGVNSYIIYLVTRCEALNIFIYQFIKVKVMYILAHALLE